MPRLLARLGGGGRGFCLWPEPVGGKDEPSLDKTCDPRHAKFRQLTVELDGVRKKSKPLGLGGKTRELLEKRAGRPIGRPPRPLFQPSTAGQPGGAHLILEHPGRCPGLTQGAPLGRRKPGRGPVFGLTRPQKIPFTTLRVLMISELRMPEWPFGDFLR